MITARRLLLLVSLLVIVVLDGSTVMLMGQAAEHRASTSSRDALADNVRTVEALLAALENEDLEAILGHLAADVALVLPLAPDGDNDPTNVDRFEGREAVRSALWRNFVAYKRIAFLDKVITPSADGRIIFVEAHGQFETLHSRPYHNVYLIKLVFNEAGAVTRIEEWTNPVTASMTWGFPLGSAAVPRFTAIGLAITVGVVSGAFVFLLRRPRWPSQVGKAV